MEFCGIAQRRTQHSVNEMSLASGCSVIVLQQATEPFSAFDATSI